MPLWMQPDGVAGTIYRPDGWYGLGAAPAGSALVADRHYATPFRIERAVTIKALGVQCTTGSAGNARFGIYADSGSMAPGSKVAMTNADTDTAAPGFLSGEFDADPTLVRGIYWFTGLFSGTPVVHSTRGDNLVVAAELLRLYGQDSGANAALGWWSLYRALAFGAMPASFGEPTFSSGHNNPVIYWQAA